MSKTRAGCSDIILLRGKVIEAKNGSLEFVVAIYRKFLRRKKLRRNYGPGGCRVTDEFG